MIRFKIKLALRNLLKNKLYSALIIGGFAIGFTACILIALFYNAENNVNTHFPQHENIFRLYDAKQNKSGLDYKLNAILAENYPGIDETCPLGYSYFPITLKDPETKDYTRVTYVISTNNNFFDIFSTEIVSSLGSKPFIQNNSAVITESVAKNLFGDKNPLGRTVQEGYFTATVTAIIKDLPKNSSFKAELLLNSENEDFQMAQECDHGVCIYPVDHFLLLNPDVDPARLSEKLNATIGQFNTSTDSLALQNISDIYLSSLNLGWTDEHTKGNSKVLLIFLAIAILIILLSSINYLNYTVSMQYAKMKEIGINKTNGAGKMHLLVDSLIEVSLGIFIALSISLILVSFLLPSTSILFGREIHFSDVNFRQLLPVFAATITGIVLLNSLAPIYVLSRFNITDFLSGGRKKTGRQIGKQVMLTFQLTVSIALIAVVILIFKQLQYVKHYDLGFNEEHLLRVELPTLFENRKALQNEITKLPFVSESTFSRGYPGHINLSMGSGVDGDEFLVNCIYISDNFLETMGIQLLEGRTFMDGDKNQACMMNEAAVKRYGWENIDDKKYKNGREGGYKVIGKVNNFNVESLHSNLTPVALLYDPDHEFNSLSLRLTPGNVGQQVDELRKTWQRILPDDPMEFTFYNDQFQAMYVKEERLAKSITFFSLIAIALTCMGILGQIFMVSLNRTKEIGIRKVNGARISEILTLLNKDFVKWTTVAFVIATPISWYTMHKWLENFAYKTTLSWWIFALAGLLALGIALLTVSWQSWRAATRNPVEALRYE
ncbi:putative ABC transport system permease protein [Mariniphaga anaerophila]|uniref:Putative ABC transport system permease protein n=1 Tax=Mariniphaga anaerophila TaxID=1484053 RepID=A0A1M5FP58_9BACT|nr:ABC transporter permease [Mariniphaga anaerophila]SHF93283.1 putative ABC transport system permease protein [Mariniphaga anaerophila]